MGTPVKERVRELRKKREGRSLSTWLYADEARMFKNIKELTGDTNDTIVNRAIREVYDSIFLTQCAKIIDTIKTRQKEAKPSRPELKKDYIKLIRILQLEYSSAKSLKDAMNRFDVPDYNGKAGTWKIAQVRKLMLHVTQK